MTITMHRARSSIRHRSPRGVTLLAASALAILVLWSAPSRADLFVGCGALDSLITCAATDVGKECQGGGTCFEMFCSDSPGSTQMTIYRCMACPTIVDAGACSTSNLGSPCGAADGGATCGVVNTTCLSSTATNKYLCQIPPAAQPTGAPLGDNKTSSGGSGCDIAPKPPKPGTIGLGLLGLGVVFFAVDKLRRRRRSR
jgi:hypothetical protein